MSQNLKEGLNEMTQGFDEIVRTIEVGHDPIKQKMSELSDAMGMRLAPPLMLLRKQKMFKTKF